MKNTRTPTIGSRIRNGFIYVIIAPTLASLIGFYFSHEIRAKSVQLNNSILHAITTVTTLHDLVRENYSRTIEYVLFSDPAKRSDILANIKSNSNRVNQLSEEFKAGLLSEKGKALWAKVEETRTKWIAARDAVIDLSDKGNKEVAAALVSSQVDPAFHDFDTACLDMIQQKMELGQGFVEEVDNLGSNMGWVVTIATFFSILVASWIGYRIITIINHALRDLSGSINHGSVQVQEAARQLTTSSEQLAQGASEQASTLEEISASLEELSSIAQQNNQSVRSAQKLASEARETAEVGAQNVQDTSKLSTEIAKSSELMTQAMSDVQACSNSISKIIKTIDEIAFQTNILALNAAVEAARAGEAGAGFAVVADEVRSLAQRSAQAARETAQMIESSIDKSNLAAGIGFKVATSIKEMNQLTNNVDCRLKEIVDKARRTNELVTQVATATEEQSRGVEQLANAVQQLDQLSQSNASEASQMAGTAQNLDTSASLSKTYSDELSILVSGSHDGTNQVPSPVTSIREIGSVVPA